MSIFQSPEWEKFKLETGWQKSHRVDDVLVLQKNLPMGKTMLYSPRINSGQWSVVSGQGFVKSIQNIGKDNKSIFYRLEIDDARSEETANKLRKLGFIKSFEEMQPEHTLIIDISKSEEEILTQMKQKGRYNIKVATKHQVNVAKSDTVDNFFALYETTAKRQKISYRSKQYFQKLFDILSAKDYACVFEATLDEKVLASAIIIYYKGRATYLFGGSSKEEKNVMAPYLLHWEIIKNAKARGIKQYDLFGAAPEDQAKHAWAGVTSFKKKFGGEYVELVGSFDLIFNPFSYKLFKLAEKIRR